MNKRIREILLFVFIAFILIVPKCIRDAEKKTGQNQSPDSINQEISR